MGELLRPPEVHRHSLPDPKDLPDDTLGYCKTCDRWCRALYDYNASGWGGMYWTRVHWWNWILRRRIAREGETT